MVTVINCVAGVATTVAICLAGVEIKPKIFACNSGKEGREARCFIPSISNTFSFSAPPIITKFSLFLENSFVTLAAATTSLEYAIAVGPENKSLIFS